MSCPFSSGITSHQVVERILPQYLHGREDDPRYPFAAFSHVADDLRTMKARLPRVLAVLSNLKLRNDRQKYATPDLSASAETLRPFSSRVFLKFPSVDGATNMRFIVSDIDRVMQAEKFYIIGFFSKKCQDSPVAHKIWKLDDKLVERVFSFTSILAYVTCKMEDETYFNYVFLQNAEAVEKWRGLRTHDSAVALSASYYEYVRINHAVLDRSMQQLMDNPIEIERIKILRTKYCAYKNGELVWEGMRKCRTDKLFHSVPLFHEVRPLLFASFAGHDLRPYSEIVRSIKKATGLPVRIVDVIALAGRHGVSTSDMELLVQHKIDFAFTRSVPNITGRHHAIPIAAPVPTQNKKTDFLAGLSDVGIYLAPPLVCSRWVARSVRETIAREITRIVIPEMREAGIARFARVHEDNYQMYADVMSNA